MDKILEQVQEKYNWLEEHKHQYGVGYIIMVSLIGSQNYHLDGPTSDIDTYAFVFPSYFDFITGNKFISEEHNFEDGSKITIKDLRLAFNLLRKPSPNSVECFISHYKIYNPLFAPILSSYLENDYSTFYLTHCNYKNMIDSIVGCARGLHGRNMTFGKKYAHVLRLYDMLIHYLDFSCKPENYLTLEPENLYLALGAKLQLFPVSETSYNNLVNTLSVFAKNYKPVARDIVRQEAAKQLVNDFQKELTEIYLSNVSK